MTSFVAVIIPVDSFSDIIARLDRIEAAVRATLNEEVRMSQQLDDLKAQVEQTNTIEQSAVTLINGFAQKLSDAIASGSDPAVLQQLHDDLKANSDALAAAVAANTAPPPPAPAPAP